MNSSRAPRHFSSLEPLEARIAPAAVLTKVSYTDIDGDHVTVTISAPVAVADSAFLFDTGTTTSTAPHQLQEIDLSGESAADGANITVAVKHAPGGDGLAAVGLIDATGVNLGKVKITGDLGAIDAASSVAGTPAIQSLAVQSLGRYGLLSQGAGGSAESDITHNSGLALGSLKVAGDVTGVYLNVTGDIGPITIGGSLIGGAGADSGEIAALGAIGAIHIGGDVTGGTGARSGYINGEGTIGSVSVKGSVFGGSNSSSGEIEARMDLGALTIGHDLVGGSGGESGYIESDLADIQSVRILGSVVGGPAAQSGCSAAGTESGAVSGSIGSVFIGHDIIGGGGIISGYIVASQNIGNVTVNGSVVGGTGGQSGGVISDGTLGLVHVGHSVHGGGGASSGYISSAGNLKGVTIGGSLIGGTASDTGEIETILGSLGPVKIGHNIVGSGLSSTSTASLSRTGYIGSTGQIASVTVGGSIISGIDDSNSYSLDGSGSIRAGLDLPSLVVDGNLIGHDTANGESPVVISAQGQATVASSATKDQAFGKIAIHGRVEWSRIEAGYDTSENAIDGNAQIGAVSVGGDWVASTLVAGVDNTSDIAHLGSTSGGAHDEIIPLVGSVPQPSIARIASIVIGGTVVGDATGMSMDQFGFASANLFPVKIHGVATPLTPGITPLSPLTGDTVIDRLTAVAG